MAPEAGLPSAAVVSVGNELLSGHTVDTNAAWLGRILADWGVPVTRRYTVGDREADIRDAVEAAGAVAHLVVVTGGLGPTPDDLTKPTVAALYGLDLVVDEGVRAALERRFSDAGSEEVPPLSRGQAEVPSGAVVFANPEGTAPGLLLEAHGRVVVMLPGVPSEMKAIVRGGLGSEVARRLRLASAERQAHHRIVHTTGLPETTLAERLEERLADVPEAIKTGISLAYLPDLLGVDLRFSIAGGATADAEKRFDALLESIDPVLRPWRFEAPSGDIAEAVSERLRRSGRTLAVAESCTGGLIAKRVTDLPGSSDVFMGGVVVYSNAAKIEQVGVSPSDIEREGAVSEVVARQLAAGVALRFRADAGIGITGVAGPGGGSDEKPVGTVWIATSLDGTVESELTRFPGSRAAVREGSAQAALARLHRRLVRASGED